MISTAKDCHHQKDRDTFQDLEGLKILVVDDNRDSRYLISFILENYGVEVMTSASALEALEVMGLFQPDVLVSDIVMPNVDGYSLIRRIRHDESPNKDIPAIAVTSLDTEETLNLAIKSGFQALLIKPVEPDDFAELILSLYLEGSACNETRIS